MARKRRLRSWSDIARAINAQIAVAAVDAEGVLAAHDSHDFFCECGRPKCGRRVSLTVSDYLALREAANGAVLADGHTLGLRARATPRRTFEARAEAAALRAQATQIRHLIAP